MSNFQAFAMAEWKTGRVIGQVNLAPNDISINQSLAQVLQDISKRGVSQF